MLIKYAQGIYDFVEAIRMCKYELYELYNNLGCQFRNETFNAFHDLLVGKIMGCLWFSINPLPLMMIRMFQNSNGHTTLVNS
jgi:hypothetical protein